jgi:hypothetical protein
MLRMCVYMHSRFVENHPIRILEDGPLISEGVLSHTASSVGWFRSSVGRSAATDLFSSLFLHRRETDERSSFVRHFGGAIGCWCCGNQQGWNHLLKMGDGACLPSCALRSGATTAMGSLYVWAMLCVISILPKGLSVILGMYCALL